MILYIIHKFRLCFKLKAVLIKKVHSIPANRVMQPHEHYDAGDRNRSKTLFQHTMFNELNPLFPLQISVETAMWRDSEARKYMLRGKTGLNNRQARWCEVNRKKEGQ